MYAIICAHCGKETEVRKKYNKYCNMACFREAMKSGGTSKEMMLTGKCEMCNEPIIGRKVFCKKCYPIYKKATKPIRMSTNKFCSKCGVEKNLENTYSPEFGMWAPRCRKCTCATGKKSGRKQKAKCLAYLGGKCAACGFDKHPAALDFHHLDPNEKDFLVGNKSPDNEVVRKELDKCVILCSNCHREEHYRLRDGETSLLENYQKPESITTSNQELSEYNARVAAELCC